MKFINLIFLVICTFGLCSNAFSSGDHHHGHAHEEEEHLKGPNGGTLLSEGKFSLEVTIFERGANSEMRVFSYYENQLIAPVKVSLSITLSRLGGEQNILTFDAEKNYLVSKQMLREPHSFDLSIQAVFNQNSYQWQYGNHEGRTLLTDRMLKQAGITTETAQSQIISVTDELFGVISIPENKKYRLNAPYVSMVEKVFVQVGDRVEKGQILATLHNIKTLQKYQLKSPAQGEITARFVNAGARVEQSTLLEVTDLSTVWVEMSAFPESIEKLIIGQLVTVSDMHKHETADSVISYISPTMTGGHIARARAEIKNPDRHWRPGMHVKAKIEISKRQVDLAVNTKALQSLGNKPVVFAKYGNQFEARMVTLGVRSEDYVEVLGGLAPGTEYVTENSFLIKADVMKSGATHDH